MGEAVTHAHWLLLAIRISFKPQFRADEASISVAEEFRGYILIYVGMYNNQMIWK